MIAAAILVPVLFAAGRGRHRLSIALSLLAAGFHVTGLIGIPIVLAERLSASYCRDEDWLVRFGVVAILVGAGLCVLFGIVGRPLLRLLAQFKPSYMDQVAGFGSGEPSISALGFSAVLSAGGAVFLARGRRAHERGASLERREGMLLVVLVALSGVFSQLSIFSTQLSRVGTMLLTYAVVLVPYVTSTAASDATRRRAFAGLALLAALAYEVYLFVLNGVCEVVPYAFMSS